MKIKAPIKQAAPVKKATGANGLTSKDFVSGQEVRWCPGCGDYSILKQMQTILPQTGIDKEKIVFISGIGCSSRFPYYLDTFGMHSIHGRATAIASGLKATRPELSVWIVSGDGDGLSIGGNHMAHLLRRNFDVNVMLFNNEIYGLTKGQYSPTSHVNSITKSTPFGSIDHPFNPLAFAMGSDGTFIARTVDRDPKHMQAMLLRSHAHKGTSFLEIYQNCNIFNDGAFLNFTDKDLKLQNTMFIEHGKPMIFGAENEKGIVLDGTRPKVVKLADGYSNDDLWIHDENDPIKANILIRMESVYAQEAFPRVFGVFYAEDRPRYEELLEAQIEDAIQKRGMADLDALIAGEETWEIK